MNPGGSTDFTNTSPTDDFLVICTTGVLLWVVMRMLVRILPLCNLRLLRIFVRRGGGCRREERKSMENSSLPGSSNMCGSSRFQRAAAFEPPDAVADAIQKLSANSHRSLLSVESRLDAKWIDDVKDFPGDVGNGHGSPCRWQIWSVMTVAVVVRSRTEGYGASTG